MKTRKLSPVDIEDAYNLYKQGFSKLSIAKQYEVHHTTLLYHFRKKEGTLGGITLIKGRIIKRKNLINLIVPAVRTKTYEEYLTDQENRRIAKQAQCEHHTCHNIIRCVDCGLKIVEDL